MDDNHVDEHSADYLDGTPSDSKLRDQPLSPSLVSEVAEAYGVSKTRLADVLSQVGAEGSPLSLSALFGWGAIELIDIFPNDTVGVSFETDTRWQRELRRLDVDDQLGRAVVATHRRQVRSFADRQFDEETVIVAPIPGGGLSEAVCRRAVKLSDETTLDVRESIVYALFDVGSRSPQAISEQLGLGPNEVQTAIEQSKSKLETARSTVSMVDTPSPMSVLERDYTADDWLGLEWTPWFELGDTNRVGDLPTTAGLYRVRHTATDEIVYIGESGGKDGIRGRCNSLASGVYHDEMPSKGSHPTRQRLWSLRRRDGGSFELSVATPPVASHDRTRRGMEAAGIAMYRRVTGHSPRVQFGRSVSVDGISPATHSADDPFTYVSDMRSLSPPAWTNWRNVTSDDWLGLNWSPPIALGERTTADVDGECVYRVWSQSDDRTRLAFVGEAETPTSRLFRAEREYGCETLFSVASVPTDSFTDQERLRRRLERKFDLQGAHFLSTGSPPESQFGDL